MFLNIKLILIRRGLRAYWLAGQLGISQSTLSEVIAGRRKPSAELRARIAEILGEPEEVLFERMEVSGRGLADVVPPIFA